MPRGIYQRTKFVSKKGKYQPPASEATKLKMSLARKGKKLGPMSEQAKRNISSALKGRKGWNKNIKHTEKHRKNLSIARRKYKMTEAHRQAIGDAQRGAKSHFWKGGVSESDKLERNTFRSYIVPRILARDNYTCQICYDYGGRLHVDHIQPWVDFPELRFDLTNCRAVCVPCHYYITFKRKMPPRSKWGMIRARIDKEVRL